MAPLSRGARRSLAAKWRSRASSSRFRPILREPAAHFRLVITSAFREIPRGDNELGPTEAAIRVHDAHDPRGHFPSPSPCNHLYHNTLILYLPVARARTARCVSWRGPEEHQPHSGKGNRVALEARNCTSVSQASRSRGWRRRAGPPERIDVEPATGLDRSGLRPLPGIHSRRVLDLTRGGRYWVS